MPAQADVKGGIRIHHESARNCTVAVEAHRAYANPEGYMCPLCGVVHFHKMVHLNLDNNGDVIVSKGVWNTDLKDLPMSPFTVTNEVKKPPKHVLSLDGGSKPRDDILTHPFQGRR